MKSINDFCLLFCLSTVYTEFEPLTCLHEISVFTYSFRKAQIDFAAIFLAAKFQYMMMLSGLTKHQELFENSTST